MIAKKGQGTIEYLVIIAIVIVIALVVVTLLFQILGQQSGIPQSASETAWKSSTPWGIMDWSRSDENITLVLKNNTSETLDFVGIHLNSTTEYDTGVSNVAAQATITISIGDLTDCTSGDRYTFPKSGIYIDYNSSLLAGKRQVANADLVGTCS